MPINSIFFQRITKNRPAAGDFSLIASGAGDSAPKLPSVIRLSNSRLLKAYRKSDVFNFNFWFKPSTFSKILFKCQIRPRLLIFHSTISLYHKKFLFRKFLMTSLHAICGLPPSQLKILAKPMFETLQTLVLLSTQLVRLLSPGCQNLNNNCTLFRIETL